MCIFSFFLFFFFNDTATTEIYTLSLHDALPIFSALKFAAVSAGIVHTCALTADSTAYCWGRNSFGQLGDTTFADTTEPVAVRGDLKFTGLTLGFNHSCALTADGSAYCWGDNQFGQLGDTVLALSS